MKTSSWKRTPRAISIALASMLLAAPAAHARLDEGTADAGKPAQSTVLVVESDGFSWADAGIGAGAALGALVAAGGAGYVVRRRTLPAHS